MKLAGPCIIGFGISRIHLPDSTLHVIGRVTKMGVVSLSFQDGNEIPSAYTCK
jgi:hypothetical protein